MDTVTVMAKDIFLNDSCKEYYQSVQFILIKYIYIYKLHVTPQYTIRNENLLAVNFVLYH